jgi:hypothetical protein
MAMGASLRTAIVNDEQRLLQLLVVSWRGRLWIAPEWIDDPDRGVQKPARLICLDTLGHRDHDDRPYAYSLVAPIPRSILNGLHPAPQFLGFEVVEAPDAAWPLQDRPDEPCAL